MKPIYLFADSQLLFWTHGGVPFLRRLLDDVDGPEPRAAYVGASNGDKPEFYEIFEAAISGIGIREKRMVPSEPSAEERAFLEESDVILLAGGDALRGFRVLESNGVRDIIFRRYYEGAVLMGVSAGAVQLGWGIGRGGENGAPEIVPAFRFVPSMIDVHDEDGHWNGLKELASRLSAGIRAIGIPRGGGLLFRSEDDTIEPLRYPLTEITVTGESLDERLLVPETLVGSA